MNILIPIETSSRDLLPKVFLSHNLALKGFHCYIGSKKNIYRIARNTKNYIYFDKGYHQGVSERIHRMVKKNDGIIVSLDEEGGLDYLDGSIMMNRYSDSLLKSADLVFFWGSKQYELVKNRIKDESKVEVTGHPRFELLKPEFHILYQKEVDIIKNKFQDFTLITTNMGFGNNIRGDEFIKKQYGTRFKNIKQLVNFDKTKVKAYIDLIINLSQKFNNKIVLRPHPEEDHSCYVNAFRGMEKIHVIYEGSVIPWILASDSVIQPDCTTALESLLLGRKPISYLPEGYSQELVTYLPLEVSNCFTSQSKLISFLENSKITIEKKDLEILDSYFSLNFNSTEKIVEKISNLYPASKAMSHNRSFFLIFLSSNIKYFLRKTLFKFNFLTEEPLHKKKFKGFDYSYVKSLNQLFIKEKIIDKEVSIRFFNPGLFEIFKRKTS